MKKVITGFIIFILISSCSAERVVDIGLLASLTGNYSPLLITARNGALLASEEINSSDNSLKLNLVIEDDESNLELTSEKTKKLLESDVDLLIMSITSAAYSGVEDLINKEKVLAFSSTISSAAFTGKDDNLIRLTPDISDYAAKLAEYALDKVKNRMLIIYDANNLIYAKNMIKTFTSTIDLVNKKTEYLQVDFNSRENPSFKEFGEKITAWNPEAVLIIASPFDTALICQHIAKEKYLILLGPWSVSEELIINGGKSVENAIFYIEYELEDSGKAYLEFAEAYENRFGMEPTFQALLNYDMVYYLYSILGSEPSCDSASFKQAVIDSGGYQGISMVYTINKFGDCNHPLFLNTIRNGKIVQLE